MKKQTIIAALLLATTMSHGKTTPNRTETPANFEGYLFAYFEGRGDAKQQEHLRFALSDDGVNWRALNENRPVIASDTISESGGIRDPHILRGEDGRFYIVATDMNTAKNGWNENPGIVLLSSDDLLHWKHAKINLSKDYPKHFGDAYWVWAPQTIYDRKAKKYMIYFTLQRNDRKSLITYYAYANKDFTGFESEPKQLFSAKYGSIDNDIIEKDGTYHLFYKGNTKDENGKEIKNGIQQATSKSLKGKWKEDFKYLDAYAGKTPVEGSSIFKLNGKDEYVLMYDMYTSGRYEYQTSTDLYHFSEPKAFTKDFFPRHGSVISLTRDELQRLQEKWGYVVRYEFESQGNPIVRHIHTADPAVFIDDDGQAYLTWGNRECYIVKLKDNMIETEGEVKRIHIDESHPFTEAPWIHKHDGKYYLTYASEWPEKIAYAVADHIEGPYETKGIISEIAGNSNTTHPAIVNFKGQWIFISHNGGLPTGTSYSRSVVAEPMEYNADGSIKPIPPTAEGVKPL